jgi:hypothetical protein
MTVHRCSTIIQTTLLMILKREQCTYLTVSTIGRHRCQFSRRSVTVGPAGQALQILVKSHFLIFEMEEQKLIQLLVSVTGAVTVS